MIYQIARKYKYETGDEDGATLGVFSEKRGQRLFSNKIGGEDFFSEKLRGQDFFRIKKGRRLYLKEN